MSPAFKRQPHSATPPRRVRAAGTRAVLGKTLVADVARAPSGAAPFAATRCAFDPVFVRGVRLQPDLPARSLNPSRFCVRNET